MAIEKSTLGSAIQQVRTARGLTQVQLAEAAGLSKGGNSIALIEQGKRFVSVETLNALAKALNVPPACLTILGSQRIATNKAATEFMQSLQRVISSVIDAQEKLPKRPARAKKSTSRGRPTLKQKRAVRQTAT